MARIVCRTNREKRNAIRKMDTYGIFSMVYVSDKSKDLAAEYKDHNLTKVVKLVVSLTKRDYEDFILRGERESKGTYCVPVSENKLLWKHKTKDDYYLRFYRIANSNHTPQTLMYYKDGKKVSKEEWEAAYEAWAKPSAKYKVEPNTYNIKLENIRRLKHGDTIVVFK